MNALVDRSLPSDAVTPFPARLGEDVLLEASPLGIARFDARKRLVEGNGRFARLLGLPIELIRKGVSFEDLVMAIRVRKAPYDRDSTGLLLMDGAVPSRPRRIERALPAGRWVRLHVHPLEDGGMLMSGLDITAERRLASERLSYDAARVQLQACELRLKQAQWRHEQEFRAQFLSEMAQELRTPLSVICGLLQLTQATALPPAQAGHLARVQEAVHTLQALIGERLAGLECAALPAGGGATQPLELIAGSRLPETAAAPQEHGHTLACLGPKPLAGMRILLAEDDESNQFVAREILKAQGAGVEIAVDGLDALAWLVSGEEFDALVMDWHMPNMNGLDAAREIRRMVGQENLPIIALSTNTTPADRQACLDAGMNAHVGKAMDSEALVRELLLHVRGLSLAPARGGTQPQRQGATPLPAELSLEEGPVIDRRQALSRQGDDETLFNQVAGHFRADAASVMRELFEAVRSGRRSHVARIAHTFHCFAQSLGAIGLANAADAVEENFEGPANNSDSATLDRLETAVTQVLESLQAGRDSAAGR